ncbi:MAG: AAA family ATPase [Spirillospora sp.]
MTDEIQQETGPPRNPFAPGAVARLGDPSSTAWTVPTTSVIDAWQAVDDYLAREHPLPGDGRSKAAASAVPAASAVSGEVVMVSGEPGSGKTHLVNEIINRLRYPADRSRPPAVCVFIGAQGPGFFETYREAFIRRFDFEDIVTLVVDAYAHVVAEQFQEHNPALADNLRNGSADPREIVQRLGQRNLSLSRFQDRLPKIIGDENLGQALSLLMHSRLDMAAWEWLQGLPPSAALVERGITEPLSETGALSALGAFATLHGWLGRRFVLVIDDLEKLLADDRPPAWGRARPLRALLDTFIATGGMLVLSALPEFFEALPADVSPRIRTQIVPAPMTGQDVASFIALRRRNHDGPTLDFTPAAVDEIVRLTGGAPRQVLRLCYRAYHLAAPRGVPVDPATVKQAALRRLGTTREPVAEVNARVERALFAKGWRFVAQYRLPGDPAAQTPARKVEYWVPIPVGQDANGCAIIITDAVLDARDAASVGDRCRAVRGRWPNRRALVVVAEYLSDDLRGNLAEAGGIEPILYQPSDLLDTLHERLESVAAQLGSGTTSPAPAAAPPELSVFGDKLDRFGRQVSQTQDGMAELAVRLEQIAQETQQQWREVSQSLREERRRPEQAAADQLDPRLDQLFHGARSSLNAVDAVADLLHDAFDTSSRQQSDPVSQLLIRRLRRNNAFEAIGVALTLRSLLDSFQQGIAGWLRETRGQPLRDADRARLESLCDTYEAVYQTVPLSSLERLGDLAQYAETRDVRSRGDRFTRHVAILRALDGLGGLVLRVALDESEST